MKVHHGNSTGYHIHVEIWNNSGSNMNPADFMGIPNIVSQTAYIFDGTPVEPPDPEKTKKKNNWRNYWLLNNKKININY